MANFTTGCYNSAMSKYLRDFFISTFAILIVLAGIIFAGEISNNNAPSVDDMGYTLDDIYNKLIDSEYEYVAHDLFPSVSTSENTMPSLEDIYNVIPDFQTIDGSTTTLSAGIYATTTLADISESGLLSENIKSGVTILGVEGTFDCTAP